MTRGLLAGLPAWRKLFTGLGVALLSMFVFTMAGVALGYAFFRVNPLTGDGAMENLGDPATIAALKVIQVFGGEVGLFIVPAFLLAYLFGTDMVGFLSLRRPRFSFSLFSVLLILLTSVPLVNTLVEWNSGLSLPGSLHSMELWMKSAEEDAAELTAAFLKADGFGGLLVNLLVIAVLPAIGEEFLFRGVLQRILTTMTRNAHLGILLTAIVFSAIHMQFLGFFPRMILGVYFGYLLLWSRSIWLPVLAHFLNNAGAVIVAYLMDLDQLAINPDEIGLEDGSGSVVVISAVLTAALIWVLYRTETGNEKLNVQG